LHEGLDIAPLLTAEPRCFARRVGVATGQPAARPWRNRRLAGCATAFASRTSPLPNSGANQAAR